MSRVKNPYRLNNLLVSIVVVLLVKFSVVNYHRINDLEDYIEALSDLFDRFFNVLLSLFFWLSPVLFQFSLQRFKFLVSVYQSLLVLINSLCLFVESNDVENGAVQLLFFCFEDLIDSLC